MTAVIGILVVFALGMGGYVAMNPEVLEDNQFVISKEDDGIQTEPGDPREFER